VVRWLASRGHDLDFRDVDLDVRRSVVDQVVRLCKTETSQKRIPTGEYTARYLLGWCARKTGGTGDSGRDGAAGQPPHEEKKA
jgi:hypothetical protein